MKRIIERNNNKTKLINRVNPKKVLQEPLDKAFIESSKVVNGR